MILHQADHRAFQHLAQLKFIRAAKFLQHILKTKCNTADKNSPEASISRCICIND